MAEQNTVDTKSDTISITERKRWLLFGLPFTFTTYTLQDKKLILKEGFLNTCENEILLYRIVDMTLTRSLLQRLTGLGSLIIEAQDKTHPSLTIKNIKNVRHFKDILEQAVEDEKIRLRIRRGELIDAEADGNDNCCYDENDNQN